MGDLFGQDIALDKRGQAKVAANGEPVLTDGPETGVQDIRLRLLTPLGSLFYDPAFGSLIHQWIKEENTPGNRMALAAEVVRRVHEDPRVEMGSAACTIVQWDGAGIRALVSWRFVETDHRYNLVIEAGETLTEVINDGTAD